MYMPRDGEGVPESWCFIRERCRVKIQYII